MQHEINVMRRVMQAAGTWDQFCKDYAAFKTGRSVLGDDDNPLPVPVGDETEALRAEVEQITDTLCSGGYDGTEGQEGSRDTTWTDFGIVCGVAARVAGLEAREASLRAALGAYRSALRSGEPESKQLREFGDAALADSGEAGS